MCFAPQCRALFRHQRPKVLRDRQFFTLLILKCASRHKGVHILNISTSKSVPILKHFAPFDFEICFAPQRRALFQHLNFQKCSEAAVFSHFYLNMCFAPQHRALFEHLNFQKCSDTEAFCTVWLRNLLRTTTPCAFSTSQLPKVLRSRCVFTLLFEHVLHAPAPRTFWTRQLPKALGGWGVLTVLTSKSASRHSGVQFLISHLPRWLGTRCFSEPTFRPSGATKHWKNTASRAFLPFRAPASSFFWLFFFSDLLSSSFSPLTLATLPSPSVHIVGSLTSKLPSDTCVYIYSVCVSHVHTHVHPSTYHHEHNHHHHHRHHHHH